MRSPTKHFAICIDNSGYKVYRLLPDVRAAKDDMVRVVDESGEDYLYHRGYFVFVDFPAAVKRKILALTRAA